VPALEQLHRGDTIIAYQTDRNELVGLAKVQQSCELDGCLYLTPIETIGVKVRSLREADPRIAAIPAFKPGPIKTIYSICEADAKRLLQAAGAAFTGPDTPSEEGTSEEIHTMNILDFFCEDLRRQSTAYFIFDTKGSGTYGDKDFVRYEWSPSFYNLPKEGNVFLYRRPRKSSEIGDFYFFGACRIKQIMVIGEDRVSALFDKKYHFERYVRREDIENFKWSWKPRGTTWEHFFNQYGMNKIEKDDFVGMLLRSGEYDPQNVVDVREEVEAIQAIQSRRYFVEDISGSPGTTVMGSKYNRAREHPCERIAAPFHGESRYRQCHPGSAELARCSGPLHTEDRARVLAHPRREHPRRDQVPPLRSRDSRPARTGCGRAPAPSALVRRARLRRASAQTVSMPVLCGPPDDDTTVRVVRAA
jgi:hypothetical protein